MKCRTVPVESTECQKADFFENKNAKQGSERNVLKIFLPFIRAYNLLMSILPILLDSLFPCTSRGIYYLNSILPQDLSNITGY